MFQARLFRYGRFVAVSAVCVVLSIFSASRLTAQEKTPAVEAALYSTMPSTAAHRPEMAFDGDPNTYFKSAYGMGGGDTFLVLLSQPVPAQSLKIVTGDGDSQDILTDGSVETSTDGVEFRRAAAFDKTGTAAAALDNKPVQAFRIRLNRGRGIPSLVVREITLQTSARIARVFWGAGRGFVDTSQAPDLADWAQKAEKQMEEFWPDAAALLYSDGFITPNMVYVVYRTGPNVTPVAATGGGVMTVNSQWSRQHPEDTGLTVHEMAHVIQASSAYNPVWLVEGIADYVRWIKFEPEHYTPRINPRTATYHDSYRTTGTFLAWCELHYDSRLATKLNRDVRFGVYKNDLFKKYCGKDVDTLWAEFIADYQRDPIHIITPPVAEADRLRQLPAVKPGSSVPADLSAVFNATGFYKDGATFPNGGGFDEGGAAYSANLLGENLIWKDVVFHLGRADRSNIITCRGNAVSLPEGKYASLWLLGAAVDGSQPGQTFTVTYADGTTETLAQNLSDWFLPQSFPGESRALRMPYRDMSDGRKDPRAFYVYSYGFRLNSAKPVKSLTLPNNPNIKILAVTLAN